MEIHAPDKPIHSLKDALVHLAIVTIGILIALSLEGGREWYQHKALVVEANQNLTDEIRANKSELEKGFLAKVTATRTDAARAAQVAANLTDNPESKDLKFQVNYPLIGLQSASYDTAQATGVFALMGYKEVRRFAAVYRMQQAWERQHAEGLDRENLAFAAGKLVAAAAIRTPRRVDSNAVAEWKRLIANADTSILLQAQMGLQLDAAYAKILGEKPPSEASPQP